MADQNAYVQYKRDTRHLLFWIIHVSNRIIRSLPESEKHPFAENTSGQVKVSALEPLSKLIAEYVRPISSTIFRIFQNVISARTAAYRAFQQLVAVKPDFETEESNASHKAFIDALTRAYNVLGGEEWDRTRKAEDEKEVDEDLDHVVFVNSFTSLNLGKAEDVDEDEESGEEPPAAGPIRPKTQSRRKGKGKGKGKKGNRGKKSKQAKAALKGPTLDEVPLESYRIIDDREGIMTEYLLAVYSLVKQWIDLRHYTQGLWREVAYSGLNSAAAGTLSNIAIGKVKETESAIFVDFPGHESYETVMQTITRGDPEKIQGNFSLALHMVAPDGKAAEKVHETDLDVKEHFLIYAYWDLLDFVTDYQTTRSGKPTKKMMDQLRNWNPNLDLYAATREERMKWRRSYTINWLYDLVNVFSSIVVQQIKHRGQMIVLEAVDWSINGPWDEHRRLFGLNEFAGVITSLAFQKPGTDVRKRILPHHVFQLQCIVDSLAVSRGWSLDGLRGHIVISPAAGFRPRRDVDLFMDRDCKNFGRGFCQGVEVLKQLLEMDAMMEGDPNRHKKQADFLVDFRDDFINWLGESKYMSGLNDIPPSRFSNTNTNGLWEYSPFLCGAGLAEALELSYSVSFLVWDRIPEPMGLIHLHNMLVQKGIIKHPIGLFASLSTAFGKSFFHNGDPPTSNFMQEFVSVSNEGGDRKSAFQRRTLRRSINRTAIDIHGLLNANVNRFFKQKSLLRIYHEAEWMPERIPDECIQPISGLAWIRLSQTKALNDPETGKRRLENTPLVIRARAEGLKDETMLQLASSMRKENIKGDISETLHASLTEGYKNSDKLENDHGPGQAPKGPVPEKVLMDILKMDIVNDISGDMCPLSSLNYIWVATNFFWLFTRIEDELKRLRNPLWIRAYEDGPQREKRATFTALVLQEQDEECMEVIAEMFQNPRSGWMQHTYWEDLEDSRKMMGKRKDPLDEYQIGPTCASM